MHECSLPINRGRGQRAEERLREKSEDEGEIRVVKQKNYRCR